MFENRNVGKLAFSLDELFELFRRLGVNISKNVKPLFTKGELGLVEVFVESDTSEPITEFITNIPYNVLPVNRWLRIKDLINKLPAKTDNGDSLQQ